MVIVLEVQKIEGSINNRPNQIQRSSYLLLSIFACNSKECEHYVRSYKMTVLPE